MKDPAALFYIDTWLTATAEMDADCKGWYLNLILHQYDKKSLPNDLEKLAVLAGVKFSEYDRFKQVFEHVLKHKFTLNETGRLENDFAKNIIQSRELFKDKRSNAGKMSYCLRYLYKQMPKEYKVKAFIEYFKLNADIENIDTKNEHMIKQVFEQMFELYINKDKDKTVIKLDIEIKKEYVPIFNRWLEYKKSRGETYKNKDSLQTCYNKLIKFSTDNLTIAEKIIDDAIGNNYSGFFEPKPNNAKPEEKKFTRVKCIYDGNEQIMTKLEYERGLEKCPELMKFIAYV